MQRTLKALAALLAYPEQELIAAIPEIITELGGQQQLGTGLRSALLRLCTALHQDDLIDSQERYVAQFDRTRSLSLHLFEHVHGDSRERGPAMVDLLSIYRAQGLEIADNELPDYLPLYVEYASLLGAEAAKAALHDVAPILAPVRDRLVKRQSIYAPVFDALLALAGAEIARGSGAGDPDEDDPEALDRAWEEAAVVFGPEAAPGKDQGCGRAATILARMNAQ